LVQIELPKDASEQSNFMAQKGRSFWTHKNNVKNLITKVGQTSEGMGASQSTAYKSDWCENDWSKTGQMIHTSMPPEWSCN
jgi:HAE1 family hydrophobic/amphiphilic exporter-1